jgi:predicted transcriptional regulator
MNSQLVIDAVVRQTMVLIARLSTVDGVRSPLSHIADNVFVSLVRELEHQRLGKKVVADMFGMALRSYRQKVQRLKESATSRGLTLWGAVHGFLEERGSATRSEIFKHFGRDDEATVRSILNDLVESGLVRKRQGKNPTYRMATAEELEEVGLSSVATAQQTDEALVWLHVSHSGPLSTSEIGELLPLSEAAIEAALERLVASARIRAETRPDGVYYSTDQCLIPVGEAAGWEAAIIDHHRAVLSALAAKAVNGRHASAANDRVGGTTLSYDIWPGHPKEDEVLELLATLRGRVIALWDEVEEYNRTHKSEAAYQVTFYCGQYLKEQEDR